MDRQDLIPTRNLVYTRKVLCVSSYSLARPSGSCFRKVLATIGRKLYRFLCLLPPLSTNYRKVFLFFKLHFLKTTQHPFDLIRYSEMLSTRTLSTWRLRTVSHVSVCSAYVVDKFFLILLRKVPALVEIIKRKTVQFYVQALLSPTWEMEMRMTGIEPVLPTLPN